MKTGGGPMGNTDAERQVRIAIVMYGGTSLAIYMNGIAQEFLQLVRATSPSADPTEALSSTARVYRRLAHVLSGKTLDEISDEVLRDTPPVTFIVDILSGTSAGGINAVMLAKALARNADLAPLKELWLDQGALDRLINDRTSASLRTPYREPVKALFNSDRMYVELLKAFERLNRADADREPLVASLDLVVTGTDLNGEPIDIRLADGVAQEYAHKHAFRFRLAGPLVDEFKAKHDPLLAFAARSTSSLPAVFEPAVAEPARALAGRRYRKPTDWRILFRSLRDDDEAEHEQRAFADGGYLDNKPFGHAIDLLAESSSSARVTRKLFYLEPQPQRIDPDAPPKGVPNALDNTLQVFSLARYETIRADIQRLNERNRLIDRIRTLDAGVLEDLEGRRAMDASRHAPAEEVGSAHPPAANGDPRVDHAAAPPGGADDRRQDALGRDAPRRAEGLAERVARFGPAYGGYHRLRVATVTDALANAIADQAQVPAESDVRRALRFVVRAWRNAHFRRERTDGFELESAFLDRFDLQFHRRRARFLLTKVNQLFTFDDQTAGELANLGQQQGHIAGVVNDFERDEHDEVNATWAQQHDLLRVCKMMAQRAVFALTDASEQLEGAYLVREHRVDEHPVDEHPVDEQAVDEHAKGVDPVDLDGAHDRNVGNHQADERAGSGPAGRAAGARTVPDKSPGTPADATSATVPSSSGGVRSALNDLFRQEDGRFRQHVRDELLAILGQPTEAASEQAAEAFYRTREPSILRLAAELENDVSARVAIAKEALADLKRLDRLDPSDSLSSELRRLLHTYWDDYVYFDMVQFPLLEATHLGEELSPVAIHRISPADVRHYGRAFGDDKLKGTTFASFGAFLDRRWREHDIRWGRLDGAERLITSLLGDGDPEARDRLICEAHAAILKDEFPADGEAVGELVAYEGGRDDVPTPAAPSEFGGRQSGSVARIDVAATRARTIRFLQRQAEDLELDPRASATQLSRLVRTAGRLSDTLSTEAKLPAVVRNALGFSSLLGSTLLDAAIPRTFWRLLTSYWSSLLVLLGAALILLGLPLPGWPRLPGTMPWGAILIFVGVAFVMLPSLVWSALSPGDARGHVAGSVGLRWFGRVALVLTVALGIAGVITERSLPARPAACGAVGMARSVELSLARTEADLACISGSAAYDSGVATDNTGVPAYDTRVPAYGTGVPAYGTGVPAYDTGVGADDSGALADDTMSVTRNGMEPLGQDGAVRQTRARAGVSPATLERTRGLMVGALALASLFAAVLAAMGLAAWPTPSRWIGVVGAVFAAATGTAGVWVAVRGLLTLHRIADGVTPDEPWMSFTSSLTKVALLLAFAAAGAVVSTLTARAPRFPLTVRALTWTLSLGWFGAVGLGGLGLALDVPRLIGPSVVLLVAVSGGVAFLLALGFFGAGVPRSKTRSAQS